MSVSMLKLRSDSVQGFRRHGLARTDSSRLRGDEHPQDDDLVPPTMADWNRFQDWLASVSGIIDLVKTPRESTI